MSAFIRGGTAVKRTDRTGFKLVEREIELLNRNVTAVPERDDQKVPNCVELRRSMVVVQAEPQVSGRAVVAREDLAKALGPTAWAVWHEITRLHVRRPGGAWEERQVRNGETGEFHGTEERLARAVGKSVRQVKRAFARLRAAGLVNNRGRHLGWKVLPVPELDPSTGVVREVRREVFVRQVFGATMWPVTVRQAGPLRTGDVAAVPAHVAEWMETTARWGGKRAGAGRKPKGDPSRVKNQDGPCPPSGASAEVAGKESRWPRYILNSPSSPDQNLGFFSEEKETNAAPPGGAAGGSLFVEEESGSPSPAAPSTEPAAPPRVTFSAVRPPTRPDASRAVGIMIPSSVDAKAALVPPPPRVTEDMAPWERVKILVAAYRGGARAILGAKWTPLSRPGSEKKYLTQLADCAAALERERIAPAEWVAFSLDVWRGVLDKKEARGDKSRGRGKRTLPPVAWVFSAKRVDEHANWCLATCPTMGGRLVTGPRWDEFVGAWTSMAIEVADWMAEHPGAPPPKHIAEKHFPGNRYQEMFDAAREEGLEYRRLLAEQRARGVWLW